MIPGSISVVGLARSGSAAARLALSKGIKVYATDAGDSETLRATARELTALGADVDVGRMDVDKITRTDAIVVSPGVPPDAAPFDDAQVAKMKRIGEMEFAARFLTAKIAAVTGTNGKSTTTALAGHLLATGGVDVAIAGNIGHALSNVAIEDKQPEWVVVEASSFQLADIDEFAPRIGVLTNLAPDHLDRYESIAQYYADKQRLFRNSTRESVWVLNGDQPEVMQLAGNAEGRRLTFRIEGVLAEEEQGAFLADGGELVLNLDGARAVLAHSSELPLLGAHNQANALAASLLAIGTGVDIASIRAGLKTFRGLPHRVEIVGEYDGVLWINDSKATNVASTAVALRSMQRPTVLMLGGRHKGEPYSVLAPDLGQIKLVVAFGEAAEIVEQDLSPYVQVVRVVGPFEHVVKRATELATRGDALLLSPACSSFDMFRNYEERGDAFRQLAKEEKHG